ncbi:polysaccharide export protein [Rhizobium leguminosarum bv. viciae]|uniref:polysaccharide biosynthesis/export family protein n=1 Tax=Rhizobium ruizarguesonis TaxID=2081791 RepID=UPI00143F65D9|nr:polysaccharide biosynthesis/export family protein [Rhizobium ruizarguesonis]NKJ71196.1 polysaccharide export protein [Rhizobium leguminosarum bv. viciae]NKQ69428.1 capsule biosynthesis protein [Rhizobium ruizarguesonis]NKQ82659.1 capsule biosynthesis protein [Rhizobium ruizarguesonis]
MRKLAPLVLVAVLSACARPSDGPTAGGFYNATAPQTNERIPVVRLSEAPMGPVTVTPLAYAATDPGLSLMRSSGFADTRLRRGDVIEVTILDTGEEGLFSSTQSKTLNLGRFTVDSTGNVTLPFVGKQRVVDSSTEALQTRIVTGLKGSAVNPQAVVTVVDRPSSGITVNGDVRAAGRFPLTARKERVLDAVALAGGASSAPGSATVTLMRGKQRATVPLQRVIDDNKQNVYLLPDDQIYIDKDSPTFTAFGAFKSVGEFEFEPGRLTLAQALGRAGGLLDDRADARNFYVLRNQPVYTQVAAANAKTPVPAVASTKPVIYRVDLKDVSNLALMQRFQMMDGDIIYASNASLVDFAKLFNVYQKSVPTAAAPIPGSSGN